MITHSQQILIHRAQREAGLDDAEYRDALEAVSGCRSTKDPKMVDRHVDMALSYMEAIYWHRVGAGELPPPGSPNAVFRQPHQWSTAYIAPKSSLENQLR